MTGSWTLCAKARSDFADMLDGLSDEQLGAQSLCSEWTVLDVGGHLVSALELSKLQLAKGIAKNRGNMDQFFAKAAKEFSAAGAASVSATLRAKGAQELKPFSEASMVADTAVHTLDVARPLGLSIALDPEVITTSLDFGAEELAKKLKNQTVPTLTATDIDWSTGSGPEVRGTAEALLLAMNNRDVFDELEGDGVSLLRN